MLLKICFGAFRDFGLALSCRQLGQKQPDASLRVLHELANFVFEPSHASQNLLFCVSELWQ